MENSPVQTISNFHLEALVRLQQEGRVTLESLGLPDEVNTSSRYLLKRGSLSLLVQVSEDGKSLIVVKESTTMNNKGILPPFDVPRESQPVEPMLQFFRYTHLLPAMQEVSKPFCDLAQVMVSTLPRNPERSAGLRKLLEAKDCAVRASIYKLEV